ncbi:uncharacterized protein PgNI_04189 [Pyricularia grisea]|uniref:Uncharacterized protein n=1 Tax=Pyricularia grisea TaxID=148305 RepID=A0A6P8BB25_PYRGI|nr:uncharacterized protein PgNI_04189 [Pyricularia grisea]TLD13030.1 hypothetical protein PgNI_04189 [Pyricularia grisea]
MSDARVMLAAAHGGFDMLTTLDSMEHDIGIKEDYQGGWVEYELLYFIFHTSPNKGDTSLVHFIMEMVDSWPRRHQWTHWVYPTFEKGLLRDAEAVFDTRETVWACRGHGADARAEVDARRPGWARGCGRGRGLASAIVGIFMFIKAIGEDACSGAAEIFDPT